MGCPSSQQSFAILPYIRGITEPLTWILKRHSIKVFKKPTNILQQDCPVPKFWPPEDNQLAILFTKSLVHHVNGVTSVKLKRSFSTRRKEHTRNTTRCAKGSNVAKHAWTFDHVIDLDNSTIIDNWNHRTRKTVESWHTAKTVEDDNNSCPLPRQYNILLNKH